jgi:hypothetical protein
MFILNINNAHDISVHFDRHGQFRLCMRQQCIGIIEYDILNIVRYKWSLYFSHMSVELPFGRDKPMLQDGALSQILGGWLVSGIYSARSGRPITISQGNNNVGPGAEGLPNLVGDPEGPKTVEAWYNTAAFEQVPSGTFGNAGRNILRGPGWVTFDMSLQRRIDVTSRVNATLRWDIFNLFDRANFGLPERNIASANAGVISTLAGDPRVMQLSVRVGF